MMPSRELVNVGGFRAEEVTMPTIGQGAIYWITIPLGVVTVITALPPTTWFVWFVLRRRRRSEHICKQCGYDLRGTPNHCPECGELAAIPGRPRQHVVAR